ncbi:MAG: HAD hydrolase-like protein [Bacteroidales bacterium]|jgi:3-deoxy-D-manno-octulosonate 8-phosphate phosphatase (KDO 8-P phosphatase)|nr:HAD hydrolase-like protein [Bacteroidales bacterium]
MANYKELLQHITTFVFDYDGVLTEGIVMLTEDGEPLRSANVRDGYALQLAVKKGYRIAVISGGNSPSMSRRLSSLGITDIFLGVQHKVRVFEKYLKDNNIEPTEVVYMGDDIPDFHVMKMVAVPACPADAAEEIRAISKYISHYNGGKGCVRDIIEQVLKLQNKWMNDDAFKW